MVDMMYNHVLLPESQRARYVVDIDTFIYYAVTSGQFFYLFEFVYEIKKLQFDQLSNIHPHMHGDITTFLQQYFLISPRAHASVL